MSIYNYLPCDDIFFKALAKNPNNIIAAAYKQLADQIMVTDPEFDKGLAVKNGTEAMSQLIRIIDTEKVRELKVLVTRAVSHPDFTYTPTEMLKARAHADAAYHKVVSLPHGADGSLISSSSGNSTLTIAAPSVPNQPGTPYRATNKSTSNFTLPDPMKEWFKNQLQGLAKESQIKELATKVTNFENTIKNVENLSTKITTLESIVPTRNEMLQESKALESKFTDLTKAEYNKVLTLTDSNKLEINSNRENITEINSKIKSLEDFGVSAAKDGNPAISKVTMVALANQYICGNRLYWRSINFAKRSGIFTMIIKNTALYKENPIPADAEDDAKPTYDLNFSRLHRVLGTKITVVKDFNIRLSLSGNLVTKCRILGNTPMDTFARIKKLIDTKHEKSISKNVHICLITPEEFDISDVLNMWVDDLKCAIKYDVTKSGGITVMINDGKTCEASGSIPAVEADKKDQVYLKSCSRLNIANPHETAKLGNPSIDNLRRLASGKWFVSNGIMMEFPDNFKRLPRNPGFVNETFSKEFSGEFNASDSDSESWNDSDSEDDEKVTIVNNE